VEKKKKIRVKKKKKKKKKHDVSKPNCTLFFVFAVGKERCE
jgi:hypothetical protein